MTDGDLACTDLGNARRFVRQWGADVRYVHPWGQWFQWDRRRWKPDDDAVVVRMAKATAEAIADEAKHADGDRRKELQTWWRRSEAEARIMAMLNLASSEGKVVTTPRRLDARDDVLNLVNGTLELATGRLYQHNPRDLLTKVAPVEYDADAICPRWLAFLQKVFREDTDLVDFVQKAVGYALTPSTQEQCFFILYGTGANGKSTFLETIRAMLGDYAATADASTFLARRYDRIPNDLARLQGVRLVSAIETEQNHRLAESVVKQVTGGDMITARFLHREFFDYRPAFKLFMAVNHRPTIRGTDMAIWRRIRLIPFTVTIPPDDQDKELGEKLKAELPGILNWAVKGCLAWREEGLKTPKAVRHATAAYRAEQDVLAGFLQDCLLTNPHERARCADVYAVYEQWCKQSGEKPMSRQKLNTALDERGYIRKRTGPNGQHEWQEVELTEQQVPNFVQKRVFA
jgi:putative DNA primase/helicase